MCRTHILLRYKRLHFISNSFYCVCVCAGIYHIIQWPTWFCVDSHNIHLIWVSLKNLKLISTLFFFTAMHSFTFVVSPVFSFFCFCGSYCYHCIWYYTDTLFVAVKCTVVFRYIAQIMLLHRIQFLHTSGETAFQFFGNGNYTQLHNNNVWCHTLSKSTCRRI